MVALDALVVATALGTIRLDLGASIEALQWTMNAYNLSFAVLLLTGAARERLGVAACRNAVLARIEAVGPGDDLQQQRAPRPAEGRLPFFAAPPGSPNGRLWNIWTARSLRLDVSRPDHLTPFLGFLSHQLPEFSRRHRHGLAGKLGQTDLQLRVGQYRVHRLI